MVAYVRGYPVRVEADYPQQSSRGLALAGALFLFPKAVLIVPQAFCLYFVALVAVLAVFLSYFAVLFTGRYPRGMFDFVLGTLRWQIRLVAWLFGLVDRYPPFSMR
jgi:hypothetical protein